MSIFILVLFIVLIAISIPDVYKRQVFYCVRNGEDRAKIDIKVNELKKQGFLPLLKDSFWALLTPVILLGGIYSGIVTTTEVACVAVVYSLLVSIFVYKSVKISETYQMLAGACRSMAPLALICLLYTSRCV